MKRFSEQLKKKSDTIRLKAAEKSELRARVVSFMEYHPLPVTAVQPVRAQAISEQYHFISIPFHYVRTFVGVAAIILVVGVPALAEKAVPGDILYPVKVRVTEEIRGSLSLDSYKKVAWETERLERRIAEARVLAQAGKLTPEVEASVLQAVQTQQAVTEEEIETLRTTDEEGATLAQLTFATMLDVQSAVLKANDSASTTMGMSTVALADALEAGRAEVTGRGDLSDVSTERLMAQLELETTRSFELLQNISPLATVKEQEDIERRLADLERKIAASSEKNNSDPVVASDELRAAWTDIQKLISFMTDIDVRASLAIETLVPVVLTESERSAVVMEDYDVAAQNLVRISAGLAAVEDPGVAQKVERTLPQVAELLATASTSRETNLSLAEASAEEARALTESMLSLAPFPVVVDLPELPVATSTDTGTEDTDATSTDDDGDEGGNTEESQL